MSETTFHRYKLKRRTTAGWASNNEVLLAGEPGIEVLADGSEKMKYGDGTKTWAQLGYAAGGGAGVAPSAHKTSHATGGTDALSPGDIGAATAAQGAKADTAIQPGHAALTDAREWSAETISQVEAEAGSATTRRAFTAQRVFQAVAAWWAGSASKTKLDGIANGATANSSDAQLRDRSTHTGTQTAATISDFAASASAAAPVQSVAGRTGTVTLGKGDVGLSNVDNTSDADKPTSTATAAALAGKASTGAATTSGLTMATARLLGRTTAGAGAIEEIQVTGGTFANGTLTLSSLPSSLSVDAENGNLTFTARWIQSTNGAASAPAHALTGTWFTGGTSTTTKPQLLIEPAGTTSTSWSTAGTGLGVNAASGFTGNLLDLQVNGRSFTRINVGLNNILLGDNAGSQITNYTGCVVIGQNAHATSNAAGLEVVAVGSYALRYIDIANASLQAVSVGAYSGSRIRAAGASVLLGAYAGQGSASFSARIQRTTCTGFEAGAGFDAVTLADNSLFGYRSGFAISSGNQNTFIGSGAGSTVTTGSNNIAIGFNAAVDSITASNQINIGGVYYHDRIEGSKRFTGNIGFFGAAAVTQPAAVADATDNASAITQLNLALARLRSLGLIAT